MLGPTDNKGFGGWPAQALTFQPLHVVGQTPVGGYRDRRI